jgi:asparagine synthase (glutamine-hydrolysing)
MCGIAGFVRPDGVRVEEMSRIGASLRHRGPDDIGFLQWDPHQGVSVARQPQRDRALVGLVHTRLAIIDLTDAGWQPMSSDDGRWHIVFNGEIYNYLELRAELEDLGHRFRSTSDTEVLLAAWAQWSVACLERLVGMWAFAVFDSRSGEVTLVRDAFGIKPLYYCKSGSGTAFCSEIPPLLPLLAQRMVHPVGLHDYLVYGLTDHAEQTMVDGILAVPPGGIVRLDAAGAVSTAERWWKLSKTDPVAITFNEAAEELRRLLMRSVQLHLRSDVPVGSALSGGVDSSAIVATVRAAGGDDLDLRAFGFVADDARLSEEVWMRLAADASNAGLKTVTPTSKEMGTDLDDLILRQGEPFMSTSIYAQSRVFRLAREAGVKVMLDGQGADEIFAGYKPHVAARITSLLREGHVLRAARLARQGGALPGGPHSGTFVLQGIAGALPVGLVSRVPRRSAHQPVPPWLDSRWLRRHDLALSASIPTHRPTSLRDALRRDFSRTLLPALLRYEDRNSMTWSLESRVPFLERDLVAFAARLPEEHLIGPHARTKSVLRSAMHGVVPDVLLDRRDKIGFETPELVWLRTLRPWVDAVLSSDAAHVVSALHLPAVRAEVSGVLDDRRLYDSRVWRWLNVIRWTELFELEHPS